MRGQIILSHGSDSSPDATKVSVLAQCAEALGWHTRRLDFRADDALGHAGSVAPRVERVRAAIARSNVPPVLVGSSMGAFASGLAALQAPVAGLFLLATPGRIPGHAQPFDLPTGLPAWFIHGWRDEICPAAEVIAFAGQRRLPLLMLDDDHRLSASVAAITAQFQLFLADLAAAA